ncbi:MAG TPA: hypothetical protein DE038_11315 [Nitrospina sp.]|nr:hypothetical protein [Nitrospina sp.]
MNGKKMLGLKRPINLTTIWTMFSLVRTLSQEWDNQQVLSVDSSVKMVVLDRLVKLVVKF